MAFLASVADLPGEFVDAEQDGESEPGGCDGGQRRERDGAARRGTPEGSAEESGSGEYSPTLVVVAIQ